MRPPHLPVNRERSVIVGVLLLVLFISPVADWWAGGRVHWITPYALWLLVIVSALLVRDRDGGDEP